MRILYLNPCGQMGGAEISLWDLLASVRTAEPDWELWLLLGEEGPLAAKARELGVQVIVAPFPRALASLGDAGGHAVSMLVSLLKATVGTALYARRLARIQRTIQPDVIHTNGFKMHVLGVWGRSNGTPVIWHIRDYVSTRLVMKRLLRWHAPCCSAAIANSESVAQDIQRACGPSLETQCVYNAVDLTQYSPEGGKLDLAGLSGLPPAEPGSVRIGLIATLARWKGHRVFLKALSRLSKDIPYRAYVIGGPIYQTENSQHTLEELRSLAEQLQITQNVGFTGFVPDPASAIRALDLVVHASTEPEPFGRVIAEAMACGRPVIISASGGARELITEGDDALSHPPGDDAILAERMAELARDPGLRQRMGRAGRATAERRFERSRLAAQMIPVYRRVAVQATAGIPAQSGALR